MEQFSNVQQEQIEKLAYRLWEERGGPLGSPEEDWFPAEQEFIQQSPVIQRVGDETRDDGQ